MFEIFRKKVLKLNGNSLLEICILLRARECLLKFTKITLKTSTFKIEFERKIHSLLLLLLLT